MEIRTIGLYQPYASLMLHGKIETRWVRKGRGAPFPLGKYLIYSTKKSYSDSEFKHMAGYWHDEAKKVLIGESTLHLRGYAIAVGELVKKDTVRLYTVSTFYEYRADDPEYELWNLWFANIKRIEPFTFKGKQGVGFYTGNQIKIL